MAPTSLILHEHLGPVADAVAAAAADLEAARAVERMRSGDHTLWQEDPTEVADRLGWLPVVGEMQARVADLAAVAARAHDDGLRHAVLLGMGGSSLFPEVLARSFPHRTDRFDLRVLDTTDPAPIARVAHELDLDACLFVAASKSGTTIETRTQLDHFWELTGEDPDRFVFITDPGSELAELGRARGVRAVLENRADIGGRYSALSYFGLFPAALLGVDIPHLLERAAGVADDDGARLAAIVAGAAQAGRDKLTLVLPREVATFGLWLEQLIAESTGKHGVGIVPVVGEHLAPPPMYGDDRLFVALGPVPALAAHAQAGHPVVELAFVEPLDLGAQVQLWEVAVALSGVVLGINPFDQPDVQAAKTATDRVLDEGLPAVTPVSLDDLLADVRPGDHVVIQAFVDPGDAHLVAALERARHTIRDRHRVATSIGIGPRFLHSTGQLHKGGPPSGVFVQVVGDDPHDVAIPGRPYGFATLKQAQAAGDLRALLDRDLRAGRVALEELLALGEGGR